MTIIIAIVVCVFVGIVLAGIIIYLACWKKLQCHTKHKEAIKITGMTGIDEIGISEAPRRASYTGQLPGLPPSSQALRAQRFRERAKDSTIGTPEFRMSHKKYGEENDIYKALANHPDLEEFKQQCHTGSSKKNAVKLPPHHEDRRDSSAGSSGTVTSEQHVISEGIDDEHEIV